MTVASINVALSLRSCARRNQRARSLTLSSMSHDGDIVCPRIPTSCGGVNETVTALLCDFSEKDKKMLTLC